MTRSSDLPCTKNQGKLKIWPDLILRKYFTFFWKQKYEQLQFALTYTAPCSFLLLTSKVLRFQRGGTGCDFVSRAGFVWPGHPSHVASWCNCSPYAANASVWLTDFQPWRSWNLDCIMLQNMQRQASPPVFETWEFLILAGAKTPTSRGKKYSKTNNDKLPIPILLLHSN